MNTTRNPRLNENAKSLRREMTKEERRLWYDFLKLLPINVNRQKVLNKYIVDFYISEKKIVIEIDGSQHYEEEAIKEDTVRDEFLGSLGLTVLRYTNRDINVNFSGVCQDLLKKLGLTWDDMRSSR